MFLLLDQYKEEKLEVKRKISPDRKYGTNPSKTIDAQIDPNSKL